jgi:microcin C transport system substrate-binding protein
MNEVFPNGHPSRRAVVLGGAALGASTVLAAPALARAWDKAVHGLSTFGDLAYPADFKHFSYVNPDAPKGGLFSQQAPRVYLNQSFNTFNSLNYLILKGDGAQGMELNFSGLMTRAEDEADAVYGAIAERVLIEDDARTYHFRLRPGVRFHDGTRLTAQDVAWSLTTLKEKGHPQVSQALRLMAGAEADGADVVTVRLAEGHARNLILEIAVLPVLSKAYYTTKPFEESTLEIPLGSGPYRVSRFEQGRYIEHERVPDFWGTDLPVYRGQNNFDRIRFEYFREREIAFEGFKARAFLFREEFTSRIWATRYDFPAYREGRVKREEIPDLSPSGTQGWLFNLRRPQFADPRVREAVGIAFDFEWVNENLMFGAYSRTVSFFQNSEMMAEGATPDAEWALINQPALWGGEMPEALRGLPFTPPASDRSGQDRALLRRAGDLLRDAGCRRQGDALRLPNGQRFEIEFLDYDPGLHPHSDAFIKNLRLLGIDAKRRMVDVAQYQRRMEDYDFDMTSRRLSLTATPGEGLRQIYGSRAAAARGTWNWTGISHPAVDMLLDRVADASTRAELVVACRALDRVLRHLRIWVPMWSKASHWIAYWDVFDRPAQKPKYDRGAPDTWWYSSDKAKRIGL